MSTNTVSNADQGRYAVQLAIYDISMGMSRTLSSQFLGPDHAIDIIPHSGVVVHGLEYFFGDGIQSANPENFRRSRGIQPIMILDVGVTDTKKDDFERWCRTVASREYCREQYDLLHRNCNNFADYALRDGLGLSEGVPEWVLDVPMKFLNSPMGMMMRPMLESMMGGGARGANICAGAPVSSGVDTVSLSNHNDSLSPQTGPSSVSKENPWAHLPSSSVELKMDANSNIESSSAGSFSVGKTPVLDSNDGLLLSSDASTVTLSIDKLTQTISQLDVDQETSATILNSLHVLKEELYTSEHAPKATTETVEGSLYTVLKLSILQSGEQSKALGIIVSYTLLLLRLVVLYSDECCLRGVTAECVSRVGQLILETRDASCQNIFQTNAMVRSMAWTVLSNAFYHPTTLRRMAHMSDRTDTTTVTMEEILDVAMADYNHSSTSRNAEVQTAAAAFLHNLAYSIASEGTASDRSPEEGSMPEMMVTLLCGVLEGLSQGLDDIHVTAEHDVAVFRGLLAVAAIFRKGPCRSMAVSLAVDLGFESVLVSARAKLGKLSAPLAEEVISLLT